MSSREKNSIFSKFFGKSSSSKSQKKNSSSTSSPPVPPTSTNYYSSSPHLPVENFSPSSKSSPVSNHKSLNHSLSEPNSPSPTHSDHSHQHFINIYRSDHSAHDLGHIISNVNLSLAKDKEYEGEDDIIYYKGDPTTVVRRSHTGSFVIEEDDQEEYVKNRISLIRSDGLSHDLLQFYKASESESSSTSSTSKRKSRAVSMGDLSSITNETFPNISKEVCNNVISLNKKHLTDISFKPTEPKPSIAAPSNPLPISTGEIESLRIVHMSDSHNFLNIRISNLSSYFPPGDIFVHSGNFSMHGDIHEFNSFNHFLESLKKIYPVILVVLGYKDVKKFKNDWSMMKSLLSNATHVLCHEEVTIKGLRFYGVPWNFYYKKNMLVRSDYDPVLSEDLSFGYDRIPFGVNVLITHGPAYGKLDISSTGILYDNTPGKSSKNNGPIHTGSHELHEAILRFRPGLHLHGFCKDSRGIFFPKKKDSDSDSPHTLSVNSCVCDRDMNVMYACPHVLKASRPVTLGVNKPSWTFNVDALDPNALASLL